MKTSSYGACIIDVKTGEIVAQHDMNRSLITASTMKIVTTATALALLGEDYRYKTLLEYEGEIKDGILYGNIFIKGGGDPSLGSNRFGANNSMSQVLARWGAEIKKLGITKIEGKIIGDASIFHSQSIPDNWPWADIGNYYGAGAVGLCLNENMYEIHLKTGKKQGEPVVLKYWDETMRDLQFVTEATTGEAGSGDNSYIYGAPYTTLRYIRGTLPPNESDFVIKGSIPDPVRKTIFTQFSPPLRDIIHWTNQKSVNLFAECLLNTIGLVKTGLGSTKAGLAEVLKYWENKGIPTEGMFLQDGSGLSPNNTITPYQMATLLRKITQESYYGAFLSSLPIAGESGTLASMCKDTPAEGRIQAKSGYMSRVRCYAGYATTLSGRRLAFAFFGNNYSDSPRKMKEKWEDLMIKLVNL
jgi:D-alanyl-D-alanine carboxypeptidase/D-alanyl-D-alanine-endopeptidase (penicillin-binding protein 4)